jgi:RND superfamily putative drug exporter
VFRALLAPLVTLFPAALALVVAGPLIAEATHIGVQVSSLLQLLLVVIVLGAGTDYGLFLIFRMREELRAGRDPKDAVVVSVTRVGESITFSGITVIAALVSLLLASFGLYKGLGPGLAIGIGVVLIANLTLLPALLALMGRAVFWPLIPKPGQTRRSVWGAVASRVVGRPVLTLVIGVTAFGGLALVVLDYSPAGFGAPSVSSSSDSARGQAALTAHFATAESNPTNVVFTLPSSAWQHPAVLSRAQHDLLASGLFGAVAGALDPNGRGTAFTPGQLTRLYQALGPPQSLPVAASPTSPVPTPVYEAYRATAQFVSADGRTILYDTSLRAGGPETAAALNAIPRVRTAVASVATHIGALDNGVAGEAPSLNDVASVSAHDLAKILPIVMLVLALLLALMLRSLVAPIYLVLSVALSYLAALGLAVLVFVVIGGQAGINFVLPFFMFIFIMALGEDYNILVMSRIREEAHTLSLPDAVRRAVQATGTTVTSAGLILAGTFAVLTAAGGTQVQEIGVGLAVGVLLDTFLVRTLLVPSTVVLIGRWNWWPSKLWREETVESRL